MKEKLEQIIAQLIADKYFAIKVESVGYGTCVQIINNATNEMLVQQFGSAKEFFESLFSQGIRKIKITPRKQNGTPKAGAKPNFAASRTFEPFEFEFEPKESTANNQPEFNQVHEAVVIPESNLKGPGGLGYAEIHKIVDYPKIERELFETKTELKIVQKELEKANDKVREYELFGAKKVEHTESQAKVITALAPFQETIKVVAAGFLKGFQAQQEVGMTGPISPVKETFMKTDDTTLNYLLTVSKGFGVAAYEDKLDALLKEFNLIQ